MWLHLWLYLDFYWRGLPYKRAGEAFGHRGSVVELRQTLFSPPFRLFVCFLSFTETRKLAPKKHGSCGS